MLIYTYPIIFSIFASCTFQSASSVSARFYQQPNDVIVGNGKGAVFDCVPGKELKPFLESTEWLKDGHPILYDSKRRPSSNGSLVIFPVRRRADEGEYRCRLRFVDGDTRLAVLSRKAKLRVAYLGEAFTMGPLDASRRIGESVAFRCDLKSVPEPATIDWYFKRTNKRGEDYLPDPVKDKAGEYALLDSGRVLEVISIAKKHVGNYYCIVSLPKKYKYRSKDSLQSRPGSLQLRKGGNGKAPEKITFDLSPVDVSVRAGGTAELLCSANGRSSPANDRPTITWLIGNIRVRPDSRHSIVGSGTLRITNVQPIDKGIYTCKASLSSSDESFQRAQLRVLSGPAFDPPPPEEVRGFNQQELTLPCRVRGKPQPVVTWRKNGERIQSLNSDEYFQMVGNSLRITGLLPADAGLYQCLAANSISNIQAAIRLYVQPRPTEASTPTGEPISPPDTPVALRVAGVDSNYINLRWTAPSNVGKNGQLSYDVVWKKRGHLRVRQVNATRTGCLIDRLSPQTLYEVSVYSVLSGVRSRRPATMSVTTLKPVAVPLPVRELKANALSSTQAEVIWRHPQEAGRFIRHFKVLVYNQSDPILRGTPQNLTVNPSSASPDNTSRLLLTGLHPYALYRVMVFAVNASGRGTLQQVKVRTLEAKPDAPPLNVSVKVTGAQTATIRWQPPAPANRNGELMAYKLRYKVVPQGKPKVQSVNGVKTSFSLRDLEKDSEYLVKISARTAIGTGPFSEWITFRTLKNDPRGRDYEERTPGKVVGLDARGLANAIVLSWFKPDGGRTQVKRYSINWGTQHDSEKSATVPGDRQEYTIRNLKPSKNYFIRLEAQNDYGVGESAYKQVQTRQQPVSRRKDDEDIPAIPMNLRAITVTQTSAILSWEDYDGLAKNSDLRRYEVRYYPTSGLDRISPSRSSDGKRLLDDIDDENPRGMISVNFTGTTQGVVNDLRPNTNYEFKVRTFQSNARRTVSSIWSFVQRFRTQEDKPGSAPQDVTLTSVSGKLRSVKLAWQPPSLPNGHIESYVIYFTADRSLPHKKWVQRSVKGSQLNLILPNLDYDLLYYIQIRARNSRGEGPFSAIRIFRTPDDEGRNGGPVPLKKDFYNIDNVPKHNLHPVQRLDRRGEAAGGRGEEEDSLEAGGLADKTWWVIIGAVFGAAMLLIICIIVCLCWCRPNAFMMAGQRRTANGYKPGSKMPTETTVDDGVQGKVTPLPPPSLKPPDLFTHRAPPVERNHYEMERRDSESGSDSVRFQPPPGAVNGGMMNSRAHARIGSQGQPIKPKPMLLPVQDAMQPPPREPVAMVTAIGGPAGMPRGMNGVMSGPLAFHRPVPGPFPIQAPQQPLPGPRVNASEIASQPSSEELQPLMSSSQISQPGPHLPPRPIYMPEYANHFDNATVKSSGSEKSSDSQSRGMRRLPSPSSAFPGPGRPRHQNASSPGSADSMTSSPNLHHVDPRARQRAMYNGMVGKASNGGSPFHTGPKSAGPASTPGKTPPMRTAPVLAECQDSASEISRGYSTEKLNQEMANLEGLMKDLNAMTQKEFEC